MNGRKQRKYQHTAEKQCGIKCTTSPTTHIVICNSGLVNGLSEESVFEHFSKYGRLKHIFMLPGKSCCFIIYEDILSATNAFGNINGKLNIGQYNKPIYLSFFEKLPENLTRTIGSIPQPPEGLIILENFMSEDEEKVLLNLNDFDQSSNSLKHRQVKHYGFEFKYDINNVNANTPLDKQIPKECDFLWKRLHQLQPHIQFSKPDQLTVNYYKPGQGIPPHVDTHSAFEDPIFVLSLGSAIVMDFKNKERHYPLLIPQRSFVIMSRESRYLWTHGITPRKMDILQTLNGLTVFHRGTRVSFTFRKVRRGACDCKYHDQCDSYQKSCNNKNEICDQVAETLEETHVHDVYESIAQHFNETRHKPWPNVLNFVNSFENGAVLVDMGCGNGKYMNCGRSIYQLGLDTSNSLLQVCKEKGYEVLIGNCIRVPLKGNIADGVISIAVIHHLSTEHRRLQAIQEIIRILKIGGKALIYVWAKEQNHNNEKSSYLKQNHNNRMKSNDTELVNEKVSVLTDIELPVHENRTQFQHQDLLVPWKLRDIHVKNRCTENIENKTYLRFYHVFKEGELEQLCGKLENVKILQSYYDQGNWCIVLQKMRDF